MALSLLLLAVKDINLRRHIMKTFLIAAVTIACVFTSSLAFANIISFSQTNFEPTIMLVIGFGLLGLAGIGRRLS